MNLPVEVELLEVSGQLLAQRTPLIKIVDAETFALAVEDRAEIKRRLQRIGELMDPICDTAHKAWKTALAKREALRGAFLEADKTYAREMGVYEEQQQRLRREAEDASSRERERLEAEERARVQAEEARLRKAAEDAQLEHAAAAEASGDAEGARRILEAPIDRPVVTMQPVFVPPVTVDIPKAADVAFRDQWSAVVESLPALVQAVAEGKAVITLVMPNTVALNGMARSLKGAMRVPGVRAVNTRTAAQKNPGHGPT